MNSWTIDDLFIKIERIVRDHSCKSSESSPESQFIVSQGKTVGLSIGLLIIQGLLNSLTTRGLAQLTKGFVFINLGITCGSSFCKYCDSIANNTHQLSLLLFWRRHLAPICLQLIISLEQRVSLTKQEDGILDLPSYSVFFLCNGLYVFTSRCFKCKKKFILRFCHLDDGLLPCLKLILRSFLILNRITMQLLTSRKVVIIHTWIFFIHTLCVMQRGSSSCSLCRYVPPNPPDHLHLIQWYPAPSAIFIAGVFAQFRVSWTASENL